MNLLVQGKIVLFVAAIFHFVTLAKFQGAIGAFHHLTLIDICKAF